MEEKAARFTILIDADKKKAFEELCAARELTSSEMVRRLIQEYLDDHGVRVGHKAAAKSRRGK